MDTNTSDVQLAGEKTDVLSVAKHAPIIITAIGYAAVSTNPRFSQSQVRLMALQNSVLDAYRNLSEGIYGLKLNDSRSLRNMVLQHNELRSYIDAYLVGAQVISQRAHEDGTFKTVVEMALQESFCQFVSAPNAISNTPKCQYISTGDRSIPRVQHQPLTFILLNNAIYT